jgi:hypothetical protein
VQPWAQLENIEPSEPEGRLSIVDPKTYLEKSKRTFWRVMRIDALIFIALIAYLIIEGR